MTNTGVRLLPTLWFICQAALSVPPKVRIKRYDSIQKLKQNNHDTRLKAVAEADGVTLSPTRSSFVQDAEENYQYTYIVGALFTSDKPGINGIVRNDYQLCAIGSLPSKEIRRISEMDCGDKDQTACTNYKSEQIANYCEEDSMCHREVDSKCEFDGRPGACMVGLDATTGDYTVACVDWLKIVEKVTDTFDQVDYWNTWTGIKDTSARRGIVILCYKVTGGDGTINVICLCNGRFCNIDPALLTEMKVWKNLTETEKKKPNEVKISNVPDEAPPKTETSEARKDAKWTTRLNQEQLRNKKEGEESGGLTTAQLVGIIAGSVAAVIVLVLIVCACIYCRKKKVKLHRNKWNMDGDNGVLTDMDDSLTRSTDMNTGDLNTDSLSNENSNNPKTDKIGKWVPESLSIRRKRLARKKTGKEERKPEIKRNDNAQEDTEESPKKSRRHKQGKAVNEHDVGNMSAIKPEDDLSTSELTKSAKKSASRKKRKHKRRALEEEQGQDAADEQQTSAERDERDGEAEIQITEDARDEDQLNQSREETASQKSENEDDDRVPVASAVDEQADRISQSITRSQGSIVGDGD